MSNKKSSRLKASLLVKLIALIVIVYSAVTMVSLQTQVAEKKAEAEALANQVEELQQDNEALQESIENLDTPEGIEDVARSKLGLVKDGEVIFYDNGD